MNHGAGSQLDAFAGDDVAVDYSVDDRYSNVDQRVDPGCGVNDQRAFL